MNKQLDLFSDASKYLNEAEDAIINMEFGRARDLVRTACEVNPFTINAEAYLQIVDFFKDHLQPAKVTASFAANVWHIIPHAVKQNILKPGQAKLADVYIARIVTKHVSESDLFVDTKKQLHWGSIWFIKKKYSQARKLFLQTIDGDSIARADLLAYYGDSCYLSGYEGEAQAAYIRALALNPQQVDLFRIQNPVIQDIFEKLQQFHPEDQARSILLFQLWFGEHLEIPHCRSSLAEDLVALEQKLALETRPQKSSGSCKSEQWHHFSVCFTLAERLAGEERIRYREKMQQIDGELFAKYMKKVWQKEQQIASPLHY